MGSVAQAGSQTHKRKYGSDRRFSCEYMYIEINTNLHRPFHWGRLGPDRRLTSGWVGSQAQWRKRARWQTHKTKCLRL